MFNKMLHPRKLLAVAILTPLVVLGSRAPLRAATIIDITSCDVAIHAGSIGVLRNDLVCEDSRIYLGLKGKLDLNGFTITKIESSSYVPPWDQQSPVYCARKCAVFSSAETPGRIVAAAPSVHDAVYGIEGGDYYDTTSCRSMAVENVVIEGFDVGIGARDARVRLRDVTLTDNVRGAFSDRMTARNLTGSGGEVVASASILKLRDADCSGASRYCFVASRIRMRDGVVQGSAVGVSGSRASIKYSSLFSNGVDIQTEISPKFKESSCETSLIVDSDPAQNWGICTLD